jgi:small conductance mechanosensitive channel
MAINGTLNLLALNPFDATVDWNAVASSLVAQLAQFGGRLLWACAIVLIGWLVISWILRPVLRRVVLRRNIDPVLGQFTVILITSILKFLLVSTAIGVLGVEQLSVAAFVAFLGIGVGQGVSDLMRDFMAGLVLVVQKPIKSGDWVIVPGAEGEVLRVGLTHTILQTVHREHEVIPNSKLTSSVIRNYNSEPVMKVIHPIFVRHTEDLRLCREVFFEACATDPRILPHPFPQFIVSEIGLDAVRLSLRMFCSQADYWHVHWDFPQLIKWSFERYGISFQISRTEVEFTGGAPKFSAFADAQQPANGSDAPPPDGDSDGESDVEGNYSLATITLEEKWKRHEALPHRRKVSSAIAAKEAEAAALAPNDDEDETDNIGDLDHYAPKVRSFDYRVARPSDRDRKRLHALTARWHELVSDIDEAERHKLASDNVVRAAKSRWRRLRRKLLKRTASTTSSADESKRLERLKSNTKQTLVGLGQLQSAQHDRELVQRVSSQKSPRKSKVDADADEADADEADADADADNGAAAAPSDGKRKSRVRRRTARRVRSSSLPSVEDEPTGAIDLSRFASAAPGSAALETASFETTRPDTARPASVRPPSARLPSAPAQEPSRRRHRGESAPIVSRRLRRTFSENALHVRHFQAQSLAPSDEESTDVPPVHVVQVDEEALATLDASGDWWEQGGFGGS